MVQIQFGPLDEFDQYLQLDADEQPLRLNFGVE